MTSKSVPPDPRKLLVDGAHNLRDLGGVETQSGRRLQRGRIFRSDYPIFALERGAHGLGLRTVVDLRRRAEAAVECVRWEAHGVTYERWPLTAGQESSWWAGYPSYLAHRPETVVGAVRAVMRPSSHPVLFHCAAGKDRTGVVAALLLAVLGVGDDAIVADHLLSDASVEPVLARLVAMEPYATMLAGSSVEEQRPRAEDTRALLDWLDDRGGVESWLVQAGVMPGEIADFKMVMGAT